MSQDKIYCLRCGAPIDPVLQRCDVCDYDYLEQDNHEMIFDEDMGDLS